MCVSAGPICPSRTARRCTSGCRPNVSSEAAADSAPKAVQQLAQEIRSRRQIAKSTIIVAEATQSKAEQLRGDGDGERNRIFAEAYGKRSPSSSPSIGRWQAYEAGHARRTIRASCCKPDSDFFRFFGDSSGKPRTAGCDPASGSSGTAGRNRPRNRARRIRSVDCAFSGSQMQSVACQMTEFVVGSRSLVFVIEGLAAAAAVPGLDPQRLMESVIKTPGQHRCASPAWCRRSAAWF